MNLLNRAFLIVDYILSTQPWLLGLYGEPLINIILFSKAYSLIDLFTNSRPLSEENSFGKTYLLQNNLNFNNIELADLSFNK